MARRDDGTDVAEALPREQRDARRRQHARAERGAARRRDAGRERLLEQRARAARVASDDDARRRDPVPRAGDPDRGLTQPERELRREIEIRDAPDAVRSEERAAHGSQAP